MGIDGAYQTSGKIFQAVSKLYQPGLLDELSKIEKGEITVVKGAHDHVEKLLNTIKVPYDIINAGAMATHNSGRVMIANCSGYGNVSAPIKKGIKEFVYEGGRLVTTDWSLGLVTAVFPGKLERVADTNDEVVEVQCTTDVGRRFIGMNYAQCHPQWWLEGSSHVYKVVGDDVTKIITSDELHAKYGQETVVAGFKHGQGEVIHFLSHLELQRTKQKDKGGNLDDFLEKMKIERTPDMDDAKVADLEAAYSTLNTVAYLCLRSPVLETDMKSTFLDSIVGLEIPKSMSLL